MIGNFKRIVLHNITWPLKQEGMREARQRLEVHKSSLNTALTAAPRNIVASGFEDINEKSSERSTIIDHRLPPNVGISDIHSDQKAQQ
ncbi:hypothetical protein F4824DRAFT_494145 [Ustulina deusta]|nr:hypothetical protein F4824DRAFT_494145 [Ustulina deusta]